LHHKYIQFSWPFGNQEEQRQRASPLPWRSHHSFQDLVDEKASNWLFSRAVSLLVFIIRRQEHLAIPMVRADNGPFPFALCFYGG
jgi:hypothetical protein